MSIYIWLPCYNTAGLSGLTEGLSDLSLFIKDLQEICLRLHRVSSLDLAKRLEV